MPIFESSDPSRLIPELLPSICRTDAFFDYAVGTSAGSLSPRTNWSSLSMYEFSLPPLSEQRRVIRLLNALEDTIEAYRDLVASSILLRKAIANHVFRQSKLMLPLQDFVKESAYGPRFPGDNYHPNGNVKTLRTTDFATHGRLSFETAPAAMLDLKTARQHRLVDGDFLLSRSGEYAGMTRVFHAAEAPDECFIPAAFLIRFRLDSTKLLPDYLYEFCESPTGALAVRSLAKGSAQPNISGTSFLALPIPHMPLAEQELICERIIGVRNAECSAEERCSNLRNLQHAILNHRLMEDM